MSRAEDRFIDGDGPLAALIRAQPAFEAPADLLPRVLAALDAAHAPQGFEPPAALADAIMAEAARLDAAQAPRRDALLAELAAGTTARDALGAEVSPATEAWLARRPQPAPPATPRRRRWPWLAGLGTAVSAALALSVTLRLLHESPDADRAAPMAELAPSEAEARQTEDLARKRAQQMAQRAERETHAAQEQAMMASAAMADSAPAAAPPVVALKAAPPPRALSAMPSAPVAALKAAPARMARAPSAASAKAEAPAPDWLPATVHIPAGPFIAGSDAAEREAAYRQDEAAYGHATTREQQWYAGEAARHTATTGAYAITATPITQRQYAAFVASTGHPAPDVDATTWASYGLIHPWDVTRRFTWADGQPPAGRDHHPVVLVSRADAEAYAAWLSARSGQRWRLPTEAEWEKAARGTDGRAYPWGNAFDPARLNSHDAGPFDTTPVGQYPTGASPFGLLDAAGQVYEWTATDAGPARAIVKGGSWDDRGCGVCRPAARHARPANMKHVLTGFRLLREAAATPPRRAIAPPAPATPAR